jgi:hypothetical protein
MLKTGDWCLRNENDEMSELMPSPALTVRCNHTSGLGKNGVYQNEIERIQRLKSLQVRHKKLLHPLFLITKSTSPPRRSRSFCARSA